jgi:hypothetical protein
MFFTWYFTWASLVSSDRSDLAIGLAHVQPVQHLPLPRRQQDAVHGLHLRENAVLDTHQRQMQMQHQQPQKLVVPRPEAAGDFREAEIGDMASRHVEEGMGREIVETTASGVVQPIRWPCTVMMVERQEHGCARLHPALDERRSQAAVGLPQALDIVLWKVVEHQPGVVFTTAAFQPADAAHQHSVRKESLHEPIHAELELRFGRHAFKYLDQIHQPQPLIEAQRVGYRRVAGDTIRRCGK